MLKFIDFFPVNEPDKTKVKFNMKTTEDNIPAWDHLIKGENNNRWLEMNSFRKKHANNNLDKADYLLSFAQFYPYGVNYYIFGGFYKVEKKRPEVIDGIGYRLTLLDDFSDYRKRLILYLPKAIGIYLYCRKYTSVQEQLNPEIYEIAPSTKLGAFPGYNNILLTHKELKIIYDNNAPDWKNALSCVKGVYCITDSSNGQIYIGSATGNNGGIWQRWETYATQFNGGNKTFMELDDMYIEKHFTYSILEIFDVKAKREEIIRREEYWKRVFQTVNHGMNN